MNSTTRVTKKHWLALVCLAFLSATQGHLPVYILTDHPYNYFSDQGNTNGLNNCFKLLYDSCMRLGIPLKQVASTKHIARDQTSHIICFDVPQNVSQLQHFAPEQLILVLWEPPTVKPANYAPENHQLFKTVFTLFDTMVDNKKYYKFFGNCPNLIPHNNTPSFAQRKLITLFSHNRGSDHPDELYSQRRAFAQWCAEQHAQGFDLHGSRWPTYLQCYRGSVPDKLITAQQYAFCICYENMQNQQGYITEKIFDAFATGTVPVYWGADNITDYIPSACFIPAQRFSGPAEIYNYVRSITPQQYNDYVAAINTFLASDCAQLFSGTHFVHQILSCIMPKYDPEQAFDPEDQRIIKRIQYIQPYKVDFDTAMNVIPFSGRPDSYIVAQLRSLYEKNFIKIFKPYAAPKIPKIIHHIWLGGALPERFKPFIESWKKHHPAWEFRLWGDADLEDFNLKNKHLFDRSTNWGYKSDLLRYEILARYGGVYVDIDFMCYKPIDSLAHEYDCFGVLFPQQTVLANGLIGTVPNHPIMHACIANITHAPRDPDMIQHVSGPRLFTRSFLQHLNTLQHTEKPSETIIALPASYFFPVPVTLPEHLTHEEIQYQYAQPESFAGHYWARSWVQS